MEKREFGALEKDIEKLEKKKTVLESFFTQDNITQEEVAEKSSELQEIIQLLEEKEERWLELSMKLED